MRKWLVILLSLFVMVLTSCSQDKLSGSKPPVTEIQIGTESYETILGTYCWKGTCVDTIGPVELLEGKNPVQVKPNEEIKFVMQFKQLPNEVHLSQWMDNKEQEIPVNHFVFHAPQEKGVYYYSFAVWWMDEKEENVSNGDAFYSFVLEVK